MNISPLSAIAGALVLVLIAVFFFMYRKQSRGKCKINGFFFALTGMLIGMTGSFLVFYNIDNTKGWNPYGWWFIASFITTVFGGLAGVLIYGNIKKEGVE